MKYRVVEAPTDMALEGGVEKLLKKGWKCQGGLSCTTYHKNNVVYFVYTQALVK